MAAEPLELFAVEPHSGKSKRSQQPPLTSTTPTRRPRVRNERSTPESAPADLDRQNAQIPKLLLTSTEAASALGIGRSKLYELIRRGVLPSVLIDGCRRIPWKSIEGYVQTLLES
jgi:excisionase family DNA binding protein